MANSKRVGPKPGKPGASPSIKKKRDRRSVSHTSSVGSLTVFRERMQHLNLVRWMFICLGVVMVLGFALVQAPGMRGSSARASGDIARINGHVVNRASFEAAVRQMKDSPYAMYMGGSGPTQDLTMRNMVLEQDIDHFLKLDAAHEEGNRVGRKQEQQKIEESIDSQIQSLKSYYKFDKDKGKAFREKLLKKMKVRNEEELRKKMRGDVSPEWLSATRDQLLIDNLEKGVRKRAAKMPIDKAKPEEIEVHARQIVVKLEKPLAPGAKGKPVKRTDAEARQIAEGILQQVKSGADFAKVAKEKSDDDFTKAKGGDMDWMGKGRFYPTELEKAAYDLKPGQVSDLVKTTSGYYILKVEGRRYSPDKYWTDYSEGLKKKAKIAVLDPVLRAYRQMNEDEQAASKMSAAAKDDAARKKADAFRKQNRPKSIARLQKALESEDDPYTRAAVFYQVGDMYNQDGNTAKAAEAFGKAAEAMPSAAIYMSLGDAQKKLMQGKPAVDSYKQAADMAQEKSFENYGTHLRLQTAFQDLKQPQLAAAEKQWLDEYKKEQPQGGGMGGFPGGGNFTVR